MNKLLSLFALSMAITVLFSCSKNESDNPVIYSDKVVKVSFTNTIWYTKVNKYNDSLWFGNINLKIAGSTNVDKVLIKTFGDGEISFADLSINTLKEFNQDIGISFSIFDLSPSGKEVTSGTVLKAIKDTDTLLVELNSGILKY